MATTTFSSRQFNHESSRAKKIATTDGPVIITDRGSPSHVLMSYDEYQRITGKPRNIVEALAMPGVEDIDVDFEFPRSKEKPQKIDFDFD